MFQIAREWRLKWSADDDKKSLVSTQQTLSLFIPALKNIDGLKSVQRIVCGGCLDYKVIIALSAEKFQAWVNITTLISLIELIEFSSQIKGLHLKQNF